MTGFFIYFTDYIMKKLILGILIFVLIAAIAGWMFMGPATNFEGSKQTLYIRSTAATKEAVLDSVGTNKIVKQASLFNWLADRMHYWEKIKPGKYDIKKGSSLVTIVRQLRNGQQTPVNFTINKIRTKEDFARLVGKRFECDSLQMMLFLNSTDSLRNYGVTTEDAVTAILPDTYTFLWNTTPDKIYKKFWDGAQAFWSDERQRKAQNLGLNPAHTYILASIVEEETNASAEKGTIASVYLNRIKTGMPLQADPTVKFALKDFGLKRIYEKHLLTESPYNTYRNRGLPPGPICTPSKATIDSVLTSPQTNYIYFVASPLFNGTHIFASSYADHLKNAKAYQQALNERLAAAKPKTGAL